MTSRKFLIRVCISGALSTAGLFGQSFAADQPRDSMPVKFDAAAFHKQFCSEHYARRVGRMAYLEARLSLKETQRPLFEDWKETVLSSARSRESACLARQPDMTRPHMHSILERQARMKVMLQSRLADLTAQEPTLKSLYDSFTPEQKEVFDHMGRDGRMGHRGQGGWRGQRGRDGHGPGQTTNQDG
jgi:hypothetical protein